MVKEFLSQRGVGFEERDVSRDRDAARELVSMTGQMGVPVTIIDGQTIVGCCASMEVGQPALRENVRPSWGSIMTDRRE
jgi:glutaredoxin